MVLGFLLWWLLAAAGAVVGASAIAWFAGGGLGRSLRGEETAASGRHPGDSPLDEIKDTLAEAVQSVWNGAPVLGVPGLRLAAGTIVLCAGALLVVRVRARRRRDYLRLRVAPYRTDRATPEAVVAMIEALHQRVVQRWWRRLVFGQPSVALEVHVLRGPDGSPRAWLAVCCPRNDEAMVRAALRTAYPSMHLRPFTARFGRPPYLLRLKKRHEFIRRLAVLERDGLDDPLMDRLVTAMAATIGPAFVQLALTPTPALFERWAKALFKRREAELSRERDQGRSRPLRDRSQVEDAELRGGLDVQHRPLCFADIRVVAGSRRACEQVASELRAEGAENRLVERGTTIRQLLLRCYDGRLARGEGNPLPSWHKGVYASTELAALWHLPSIDFAAVPFARAAMPVAPAPPAILRPTQAAGLLGDEHGPVTIHPELRRQNTAVPGAVEQGKSSYLVATIAEDLRRERCAVIVLDPKGDAADAAVSLVPDDRVCTILDFAAPTCGFNPLAVDVSPDTIADYVVGAMRNLFDEGDIRASSDRYLRNAIIAVLAYSRATTLWDATRLLSVTREGYAYRTMVGRALRGRPEYKEIADFFTEELAAQLRDAKAMTTAKLDAPVNKAARLLNSPSMKRVLLNRSLTIDFDRIIAGGEVLVVKGATGGLGADNTSVLMQLLVGMLDAALARQQDHVPAGERTAVALKIDEAPLVINRGFAQTLALKRSAGLETVACWQADSQWTDKAVRDQLDALFAHRVYFATASAEDARAASNLMMAEFADIVRTGDDNLSALGRPDVRLHLPKHWAICSWTTPQGRQQPFVAQTLPLRVDEERIAHHMARQVERGGRLLEDFTQPHWDRDGEEDGPVEEDEAPVEEDEASADGDRGAGDRRRAEEQPVITPSPLAMTDAPGPKPETPPAPAPGAEQQALEELRAALAAETSAVLGTLPPAAAPPAATGDGSHPAASTPANTTSETKRTPPPLASSSVPAPEPDTQHAAEPPATYVELTAVDEARSVRWPRHVPRRPVTPDRLDFELLAWLCEMRFALATQIHRRFNADKAYTTTQRRLKRMSEAGWVQRLQFFRDTGASSALVYLVTEDGIKAVKDQIGPRGPYLDPRREWKAPSSADPAMRGARHDLHVTAWVLALQAVLGDAVRSVRGPRSSYLAPPTRTIRGQKRALGPDDLELPGGRRPHGFLRTDHTRRQRVEIECFEGIEPDAVIELAMRDAQRTIRTDVLVELDRTGRPSKNVDKFERYDHLISGWWTTKDRYAKYLGGPPIVLFVCGDEDSALEFCRAADRVVTASHSYGGERASEWSHPGRERMLFVAERAVHQRSLDGLALQSLPPEVRVTAANGDRGAAACHPLRRGLPAAVTPNGPTTASAPS